MPPVITPSGLSLTRSLYLYERVREYVRDPQKRDKVCPKPSPGTGPDSGNASSLPESDQPGPSNATPHSPTVEGHESTEDTYSEMQDGGDDCVSGRRKRRPRSELILAYQCTVCGNKYASGSALSTHKKNTAHKQPAVPGDEHGGATKADNSSVDEGSQGPSKRRRRKKSEIVTGHFLVQCVASSMAPVALSTLTRRPSSMVHCNEPDCEKHALYVV